MKDFIEFILISFLSTFLSRFQIRPIVPSSAAAGPVAPAVEPAAPERMSQQEVGDGRNERVLCVARSYVAIPPGLKHSLKTTMTPEDKEVLMEALDGSPDADVVDLLVLWETVQGRTDMLIELANLFRNTGRTDIVALIEPYL